MLTDDRSDLPFVYVKAANDISVCNNDGKIVATNNLPVFGVNKAKDIVVDINVVPDDCNICTVELDIRYLGRGVEF